LFDLKENRMLMNKRLLLLLLAYLEERDSSIIHFTGIGNKTYSVWFNSKSDNMIRFWLKNDLSGKP
jgi:site-specific recombinase XerC